MKTYYLSGKFKQFDIVEGTFYFEKYNYKVDAKSKLEAKELFTDYIADLKELPLKWINEGLTINRIKAL